MNRDEVLHIRVTVDERAAIEEEAERDNRKLSDFVRVVVLREVRRLAVERERNVRDAAAYWIERWAERDG